TSHPSSISLRATSASNSPVGAASGKKNWFKSNTLIFLFACIRDHSWPQKGLFPRLAQHERPHRQPIHIGSPKAVQRLPGGIYDRLFLVDRRFDQPRPAAQRTEPPKQFPIQRIHVPLHRLQPPCPVRVRHRRNPLPRLLANPVCLHQERRRVSDSKYFPAS